MNAQDLYRAGKLTEAVAAQNEEVRSHPGDIERRSFLSELLCLAGNLERADAQLEAIDKMHKQPSPMLGLMRQLIRAEKTRQEVLLHGRAPEFLSDPPRHASLCIEAAVALRAGDPAEAGRLCAEAEEVRPRSAGKCDGKAFDDFRDLDDLTAGFLEVLTSTGKYFWIPFEKVREVRFDAPSQPLDLLWRPAEMDVADGPQGKVFLPAIYPVPEGGQVDDGARLGRNSDWVQDSDDAPMRGVGLRTFLVGEEALTLMEITSLEFEAASA